MPSTFFKFLGLASVAHVLGGIMAGITVLEKQDPDLYVMRASEFPGFSPYALRFLRRGPRLLSCRSTGAERSIRSGMSNSLNRPKQKRGAAPA